MNKWAAETHSFSCRKAQNCLSSSKGMMIFSLVGGDFLCFANCFARWKGLWELCSSHNVTIVGFWWTLSSIASVSSIRWITFSACVRCCPALSPIWLLSNVAQKQESHAQFPAQNFRWPHSLREMHLTRWWGREHKRPFFPFLSLICDHTWHNPLLFTLKPFLIFEIFPKLII